MEDKLSRPWYTVLSLTAASLAASTALTIAFAFWAHETPSFDTLVSLWVLFSIVLLLVSLTLGVIIHAVGTSLRVRGIILWYLLSASVLGAGISFLMLDHVLDAFFHMDAPWGSPRKMSELRLQIIGFGAVVGGATAALFWLIRRPDRDA